MPKKLFIISSLALVSFNSAANKIYDDCISMNKPQYHKMINEGKPRAETKAFFQQVQNECSKEASADNSLKHKSVYEQCMKEQKSYHRKLQASGRLEATNKNMIAEWKTYCKLEADTKTYPNIYQVRLHGVIDPKVSNTKGGLVSDTNQAKICWVKNPPPSCNQK